jgi:hypothetical protein
MLAAVVCRGIYMRFSTYVVERGHDQNSPVHVQN